MIKDLVKPMDDSVVGFLHEHYHFKHMFSLAYFSDIDIDPEISRKTKRAESYFKRKYRRFN